MKTKLLFTFLSILTFFNSFSQTENSNYVSSLINPSKIINQGNVLYIQGDKNLYKIDTSAESPVPVSIYSPEENFYINNLTINGDIIYVSEENYDAVNNTSSGSRIVAIDLNNLSTTVIYTTLQYVSSLAIKGDFMYFTSETTPDAEDNYTVQVLRFIYSSPNSSATVIVDNLTQNDGATDMTFYSNNLLILVGHQGKVFGFDVTDTIDVTEYYSNTTEPTGFCVSGNSLFIAEGNIIKYKANLDSDSEYVAIATNTNTFAKKTAANSPFEDVVLIGDKLFMTIAGEGKVTTVQDATLSTNDFNQGSNLISIYNSNTKITIDGLDTTKASTIYNLSGQQIISKTVSPNDNTININSLSNGVYILKLEGGKTFKFVK